MSITTKTAICLDISGSTSGSFYYERLPPLDKRFDEYFLWNDRIKCVDRATYRLHVEKQHGYGGTSPQNIVSVLKENGITELTIITDGEISRESVLECDRLMEGLSLVSVTCYVISSKPDITVILPFCRKSDCTIVSIDETSTTEIRHDTNIDYTSVIEGLSVDTIDSLDMVDFIAKLKLSFTFRSQEIRDLIANKREQLLNSTKASVSFNRAYDHNAAQFKLIHDDFEPKYRIAKVFDRILKELRSEDTKLSSLIKSTYFADSTVVEFVDESPPVDECIITLEADSQVLAFNMSDEIVSDKTFMSWSNNPLLIPTSHMRPMISRVYGYEAYTRCESDPYTRRQMVGFIPMYDTAEAYHKQTALIDSQLCKVYFRSKDVHNVPLLLWSICDTMKGIVYVDQRYKDALMCYTLDRIESELTILALSKLPMYPHYLVPIPIAILYSSCGPYVDIRMRRHISSCKGRYDEILDRLGYSRCELFDLDKLIYEAHIHLGLRDRTRQYMRLIFKSAQMCGVEVFTHEFIDGYNDTFYRYLLERKAITIPYRYVPVYDMSKETMKLSRDVGRLSIEKPVSISESCQVDESRLYDHHRYYRQFLSRLRNEETYSNRHSKGSGVTNWHRANFIEHNIVPKVPFIRFVIGKLANRKRNQIHIYHDIDKTIKSLTKSLTDLGYIVE